MCSRACSPGVAVGTSTVSVQPGAGKLSGAGLAAPKRLSTLRKLGAPDAANRSSTSRSVASAPNGTSSWCCTKPARP